MMENTHAGEAPALNPHDAPEGFLAVESTDFVCTGCGCLRGLACTLSHDETSCLSNARTDGHNVIFVRQSATSAEGGAK